MSSKIVTCAFAMLSVLAVGCASSDDGATGDDQNVTAGAFSGCAAEASAACTPEAGSPLRKGLSDLLRFSISDDLKKNGVAPKDSEVKFVFKTLLIQHSHIYASATIMRGDGTTNFDMTGTRFAGKSNTVQALLEVESGSEFVHKIGIGLEPKKFACEFVTHRFDAQAPGMYPGNMKADCTANPAVAGDGDGDGDGGGDGDGDIKSTCNPNGGGAPGCAG